MNIDTNISETFPQHLLGAIIMSKIGAAFCAWYIHHATIDTV